MFIMEGVIAMPSLFVCMMFNATTAQQAISARFRSDCDRLSVCSFVCLFDVKRQIHTKRPLAPGFVQFVKFIKAIQLEGWVSEVYKIENIIVTKGTHWQLTSYRVR
jgi:hypothetical protein